MAQETQLKYMHRCEMNLECLVILNKKRTLQHFNKMILATPKDDNSDDEMKDFIDKRNKAICQRLLTTMENNRKETKEEISAMREEIRDTREEIKAMEQRIAALLNKDE